MFYSVCLGKGNSGWNTQKLATAFNESPWIKDHIHATDNLFLVKASGGISCKDITDMVDVVTNHDMDVFVSPVGPGYSALFSPPGLVAEWIKRNESSSPAPARTATSIPLNIHLGRRR